MTDDLTITEQQVADIKAAEYLGKGYKVTREVPLEFLPGYRADLIVEKDGETKVIEIKTRSSLRTIPALREVERVVNARQGWSFELQIVGEPEKVSIPERSRWLDEEAIRARLTQAELLNVEGLVEAALLMAWAAVEAAVRTLVADEGVQIDRATDPGYVLNMAVAHGAISREHYRALRDVMVHRNAVAHGFVASDVTPALVTDLIAVVISLLREHEELSERPDTPG